MRKTELEIFFGTRLSTRKLKGSMKRYTRFSPVRKKGIIQTLDWDKVKKLEHILTDQRNIFSVDGVFIYDHSHR